MINAQLIGRRQIEPHSNKLAKLLAAASWDSETLQPTDKRSVYHTHQIAAGGAELPAEGFS